MKKVKFDQKLEIWVEDDLRPDMSKLNSFINSFRIMNRTRNFSLAGRKALYEYFHKNKNIEKLYVSYLPLHNKHKEKWDIMSICDAYSEFRSEDECKKYYYLHDCEKLSKRTTIITFSKGVIVKNF